jgi:hypothetical protein
VHKEFYRLHDNVIELSKISKLLLASEAGSLHKFQGTSIADMSIESLLTFEGDGSREEQEEIQLEEEGVMEEEEGELPQRAKTPRLSKEERDKIFSHFEELISLKKIPGKKQCNSCISATGSSLDWQEVKRIVSSRVQKERAKAKAKAVKVPSLVKEKKTRKRKKKDPEEPAQGAGGGVNDPEELTVQEERRKNKEPRIKKRRIQLEKRLKKK